MESVICSNCGGRYSTKQSLTYHIRTVHEGMKKKRRQTMKNKPKTPFQCPDEDCPNGYSTKDKLIIHLRRCHRDQLQSSTSSEEPVVKIIPIDEPWTKISYREEPQISYRDAPQINFEDPLPLLPFEEGPDELWNDF